MSTLNKLRIGPFTAVTLVVSALVLSTLSSRADPDTAKASQATSHVFVPTSVEISGSNADAEPAPTF